jgi:hypothetical protein
MIAINPFSLWPDLRDLSGAPIEQSLKSKLLFNFHRID